MDREQDVADVGMFAVDSSWGGEAILQEGGTPWLVVGRRLDWGGRGHSAGRRHTVAGNREETGLGWQSPLERAV